MPAQHRISEPATGQIGGLESIEHKTFLAHTRESGSPDMEKLS